jgi:hypothetical protein
MPAAVWVAGYAIGQRRQPTADAETRQAQGGSLQKPATVNVSHISPQIHNCQ